VMEIPSMDIVAGWDLTETTKITVLKQ
jgi:hypothetical protein